MTWPREKEERVLVIGVFGALALCSVSLFNAVFSTISRLTASHIFMALVTCIGGWFYCSGSSIQVLSQRSSKCYTVSGHTLMHLCSLIASIFHASILVSTVCIWQTLAPARTRIRPCLFLGVLRKRFCWNQWRRLVVRVAIWGWRRSGISRIIGITPLESTRRTKNIKNTVYLVPHTTSETTTIPAAAYASAKVGLHFAWWPSVGKDPTNVLNIPSDIQTER